MTSFDQYSLWIKGAIKRYISKGRWIPLYWSKSNNWGDALNPVLVELISGKKVRYEQSRYTVKYFCIGSVLGLADEWSTIWGTGLISASAVPKSAPFRILAVRGPFTKNALQNIGISCPSVYGDPALLLPRYMPINRTINYPIGIVPHYTDKNHPWIEYSRKLGAHIIDIESDIEAFVHELTSCERILSSSLHGLICADAYGVPNCRIVLDKNVIGGDFKFLDYYASINHRVEGVIEPRVGDNPEIVSQWCCEKKLDIDLDRLVAVCPFI